MKMHNKCICPIYDIEDMADRLRDLNDIMRSMPGWEQGHEMREFEIYGRQKYFTRKLD